MPDIYALHTKSKIGWVKRLNATPQSKWSLLTWYMLNIDKHLINHKLTHSYSKKCRTPFHEQLLNCWLLAKCTEPINTDEIYEEYLFHNNFICSNKKVLNVNQFKLNRENNKDIKLKSLFNEDGRPKSFVALKNLTGI